MEFLGLPKPFEASSLLGVPGLSTLDLEPDLDLDDDECEVVIGIRPKSSPMPRRKSFSEEEDSEPGPPPCGSRRVSFADSLGLTLVQVKEFDTWDVPKLSPLEFSENKAKKDTTECFLSPLNFSQPLSAAELLVRVKKQKVELDTIEILPDTTTLRGVIRVLNVSFSKAVYVRTTLDTWSSHFDLLAEYMPGASDSQTDRFSFKLTLVPPFGPQGARVDFCLRYETPVGTFWANNNNANYVLFCRQQVKAIKEMPRRDSLSKKSCLKTSSPTSATAVEINSAAEKSCQESESTEPSRNELRVETINALPVTNKLTETSPAGSDKIKAENQQNSSKRNRRRAARMARIKGLFAQRDKDGSVASSEANEAMRDKPHEKNWSEAQSLSQESSKSEGSPENSDEQIGRCQTITQSSSSSSSIIEPEVVQLSETVGLHEGQDAARLQSNSLDTKDERASAECLDISQSVSSSESMMNESVTSEMSNETTEVTRFTFETVLAPLYQHAFGGVESVSTNASLCGDPVKATLKTSHLVQSCIHADKKEVNCSTVNEDGVHGNAVECQESQQKCPHTSPIGPFEEGEASLSETKNGPNAVKESDRVSTNTGVVPQTILRQLHTVNRFDAHLENPQISTEGRRLQGGEQEDDATQSAQKQTVCEKTAVEAPTLIKICPRAVETGGDVKVVPDLDTSLPEKEAECVGDEASLQTSSDDFSGVKLVLHLPQQHIEGVEDKEDTHGYTAVQSENENSSQCDLAHHGMVCYSDSGVKNWQTMVDEEEENILMEENESQANDLGREETEAVVPPEDSGAIENKQHESEYIDEQAVIATTVAVGKTHNLCVTKLFWPEQDHGQKLNEKMCIDIKKQSKNVVMAETDRGGKPEEEKNAKQEVEIKVDTAVVHQVKQIFAEKVVKGGEEEQQQQEKETEEAMLTNESRPAVHEPHDQPEEETTTKQEGEIDLSVVYMAKQILFQGEEQVQDEEEMASSTESKSAVEEQLDGVCVEEVAEENLMQAHGGFQGADETSWDCRDEPTERPGHAVDCESSKQVILTNEVAAPVAVDVDMGFFKENVVTTPTEGPEDLLQGCGDPTADEEEREEEAPQNPGDQLEGLGDPPTAEEKKEEKEEERDEKEEEEEKEVERVMEEREAPQNPEDLQRVSGDPPSTGEEVIGVENKEGQETEKQEVEVGDPPVAEEEGKKMEEKEGKEEKVEGKQKAPQNPKDLLQGYEGPAAAQQAVVEVEKEEKKHDKEAPYNLRDLLEAHSYSPAFKEEEERQEKTPQDPGDLLEGHEDHVAAEEAVVEVEKEEKKLGEEAPYNLRDLLEAHSNCPAFKEKEEEEEEEEREKKAPQDPGDLLEGRGDPSVVEQEEEEVNEEDKQLEDQGEEEEQEEEQKGEEEVVKEEEEEWEWCPWTGDGPGGLESSESDSEDEVELYMHCLRAVHAGEQSQRDQSRGTGLGLGGSGAKVLAFRRSKRPPATPMPSISESLDEELPPGWPEDQDPEGHRGHEGHGGLCDARNADSSDLMSQKNMSGKVLCWKDKFSSTSFAKTLLSATLFVVFVLVAYHYDFLACFGLYVISVIWLCCRGHSQPVKNDRMG